MGSDSGCCCLVAVSLSFFGFWTFFSIVGSIHYAVWYPQFELHDVHIRAFNVTEDSLLTYDMDVVIQARHFSGIRRIERHSYEVHTSHVGLHLGSSGMPAFHPGRASTKEVVTTQRTTLLPMGPKLGPLVKRDLNATGRVSLRMYLQGEVYTNLFLAQRSRKGKSCDLIVSPGNAVGDQVYEKKCCGELRCLRTCRRRIRIYCCRRAVNCCLLPPSDPRSTVSICG